MFVHDACKTLGTGGYWTQNETGHETGHGHLAPGTLVPRLKPKAGVAGVALLEPEFGVTHVADYGYTKEYESTLKRMLSGHDVGYDIGHGDGRQLVVFALLGDRGASWWGIE
jgi:hypothetical protein